ncbi:unnamed protein product [Arctia plantaginis]|uniref:Uncharacterized protein n=1 Tax=Arctia plantaginis TaxID=874455 RepID=A0A8S0ZJS6_ARCPL|nr:unnamed protein product [Arctia plantaginis]CAB3231956.1 unnamed protein product [Arctia plantaginis]
MDVVTRWNSTLDMIERICLLQEPLEASLGILHNPVENLLEAEWQTLPEIIKILKPFKQLTEEMSSGKKVTVSMIIASTESMLSILYNLETNIITDTGKKLANKISTEFKIRFKNCYRHPVLSKAALLDPRFKKLAFRFDASSYESAKDALKTELQNEFNFNNQPIEANENELILATSTGDTDANNDSIWIDFDTSVIDRLYYGNGENDRNYNNRFGEHEQLQPERQKKINKKEHKTSLDIEIVQTPAEPVPENNIPVNSGISTSQSKLQRRAPAWQKDYMLEESSSSDEYQELADEISR